LKPQKVKENIESHQEVQNKAEPDLEEAPSSIGGVKILLTDVKDESKQVPF
jgi:hypothetical protein